MLRQEARQDREGKALQLTTTVAMVGGGTGESLRRRGGSNERVYIVWCCHSESIWVSRAVAGLSQDRKVARTADARIGVVVVVAIGSEAGVEFARG